MVWCNNEIYLWILQQSEYQRLPYPDCSAVESNFTKRTPSVPIFAIKQNVTYRSILGIKCNNEEKASLLGLNISCTTTTSKPPAPNITAVKFLKKHKDWSWKYAPTNNLTGYYRSCVVRDARCSSNKLDILPICSRTVCFVLYGFLQFMVKEATGTLSVLCVNREDGWFPSKRLQYHHRMHPRPTLLHFKSFSTWSKT